jgi:hypothetical protein
VGSGGTGIVGETNEIGERQESHGPLEIGKELGILSTTRRQLVGGELESRSGFVFPYKLDEVQQVKMEEQGRVRVEDLYAASAESLVASRSRNRRKGRDPSYQVCESWYFSMALLVRAG